MEAGGMSSQPESLHVLQGGAVSLNHFSLPHFYHKRLTEAQLHLYLDVAFLTLLLLEPNTW